MDPSTSSSSYRARGGSTRRRENRVAGSSSTRKRRSVEVEANLSSNESPVAIVSNKRKGKARDNEGEASHLFAAERMAPDGRVGRSSYQKASSLNEGPSGLQPSPDGTRVKRHRFRRHRPVSEEVDTEQIDVDASDISDYERLKKEVEQLRKQLHETKKNIRKQGKMIEQLNQEKEARSLELEKLKSKSLKNDEVLTTIESQLSCLICMDTLLKPFVLSPCGHVYCQSCLQDWFRHAPPGEDDMADVDDENAILHRRKTCPSCRGDVRSRPVPIFLIKSLAGAFAKARASESGVKETSSPPSPKDPWEGIFYQEIWDSDSSNEEADNDEDEDEDEDEDDADADEDEDEEENELEDYDDAEWGSVYGYGTGSDEEAYEGDYVDAQWAPPSIRFNPELYDSGSLSASEVALLRRGATLPMIETYRMRYAHETGIRATYRTMDGRRHTLFLGWNITLHPEDHTGHEYMEWIWRDVTDRQERWYVVEGDDGTLTASRLVREDDIDEDGYDTSDTEAYIDTTSEEDD